VDTDESDESDDDRSPTPRAVMDYAIALGRNGVERAYEARWAFAGTFVLWIPLLLWFLGNRPGFMTFDTFDVWRQVVTHHWEDTHPVSYVIAMKFSPALSPLTDFTRS